jgi:raffinose/stachyose/melibiose transport system substrate-binding protein
MKCKKISLLITALLIGSTFAGCGTKPVATPAVKKDPVKISFFTGKVETVDLVNDMIKQFNAENPGIIVEQEFQKDASNVIKVKFASGAIPDITTVVSQDYVDQGKYVDLSNESAWWSRVQPSIKEMCTDVKTGKQYEIASNMTMAGLYYNKKIFSDLGLKEAKTWVEFKNNLMTIKDKKPEVVPMFVGGKEPWMLGHLIEFMPHGIIKQKYGATETKKAMLANDDSKLQFATEGGPMDTFAKKILGLKESGLFNKDFLTATYDNQLEAFATGKAAIISQGMWALSGILDKNKDFKDIGFSPYPSIVDGTKPVILSAEDSVYAITTASTHKEEAKKFLDFMFKAENLKKYSETTKSPSAFIDVKADWGILKDEVSMALTNGVNIGFTSGPSGFSGDDAGRMVQELYAGKYKTSLDFAKAYKATWDKAWNATNK